MCAEPAHQLRIPNKHNPLKKQENYTKNIVLFGVKYAHRGVINVCDGSHHCVQNTKVGQFGVQKKQRGGVINVC